MMLSRLCLFSLVKHAMVAKRRNVPCPKCDCYNITYQSIPLSGQPFTGRSGPDAQQQTFSAAAGASARFKILDLLQVRNLAGKETHMAQSDISPAPFPIPGHNHVACLTQTLDRARIAFESQGLRLTDLRLRVFKQIAASHHAVGAYDIIEQLSQTGTRLAPVSVYRAIEALIEAGVVHRLESKNAFFACHANHASQRQNVVLSCGACGTIAEVDGETIFSAIDALANAQKFEQASRIVEITGRCAHCSARTA